MKVEAGAAGEPRPCAGGPSRTGPRDRRARTRPDRIPGTHTHPPVPSGPSPAAPAERGWAGLARSRRGGAGEGPGRGGRARGPLGAARAPGRSPHSPRTAMLLPHVTAPALPSYFRVGEGGTAHSPPTWGRCSLPPHSPPPRSRRVGEAGGPGSAAAHARWRRSAGPGRGEAGPPHGPWDPPGPGPVPGGLRGSGGRGRRRPRSAAGSPFPGSFAARGPRHGPAGRLMGTGPTPLPQRRGGGGAGSRPRSGLCPPPLVLGRGHPAPRGGRHGGTCLRRCPARTAEQRGTGPQRGVTHGRSIPQTMRGAELPAPARTAAGPGAGMGGAGRKSGEGRWGPSCGP